MSSLLPVVLILISITAILAGFFLILNPVLAIEVQKRFYERINWRIEPISVSKEIRNTRIMGLFLISIAAITILYIFFLKI